MKSEHRHELKMNELEKLAAKLRPFFEKHGMQIVLGISAVVVVAAAVLFWTRTSTAEKAAGWTQLYSADTAEKSLAIAESEDLADRPVAAWARLMAAEDYLQSGIRQSLKEREGDRGLVSDLDKARENFNAVLDAAEPDSALRERALYGLARCLETMAGVNQRTDRDNSTAADLLDEAVKAYEKLVQEYPVSPYNRKRFEDEELGRIERHLQFLKSEQAAEFYAWLRTQNPKSQDRRSPLDMLPPGHPGIDEGPVMLPDIPDRLQLPIDGLDTGPAFPTGGDASVPAPNPPSDGKNPPPDGTDAIEPDSQSPAPLPPDPQ